MDNLIASIVENRTEYDANQNKKLEEIQLEQSQGELTKFMTEGLQQQMKKRSYRKRKKQTVQQPESSSSNTLTPSTSSQVGYNGKGSEVQTKGRKKKITGRDSTTARFNIIECDGAFNDVSLNDMKLVLKPHPKKMDCKNQLEKDLNKTNLHYLTAPPVTTGMLFKLNNIK